ncbi:hypothetical protein [Streptomyces canus]|uniref:hypothetical protein n=1 Tax=Streptomyces canus TaxID=58343 RepID=UPI0027885F0C|nr:hypothetical protein [Streptomyces canus]MDQ0762032.1 hypothetical protein [Streptomyces canus]
MDTATANEVFAAAATASHWKRTNLGLTVLVSHDRYWYLVQLPAEERAEIIGREGIGGDEWVTARATWPQTIAMVDAAMAATRV